MMGDVAKGLKSFKQGLSDDDKPAETQAIAAAAAQQPIDITPSPTRPTARRRRRRPVARLMSR